MKTKQITTKLLIAAVWSLGLSLPIFAGESLMEPVMTDGVHQYKCENGKRFINEAAEKAITDENKSRQEMLADMSERKLSRIELLKIDSRFNVFPNQTYFACEKYAQLYDLLIKQWELQTGQKFPGSRLSSALGEYNRCPQEYDNKRAVEELIQTLQKISK